MIYVYLNNEQICIDIAEWAILPFSLSLLYYIIMIYGIEATLSKSKDKQKRSSLKFIFTIKLFLLKDIFLINFLI